MSCLQWPFTDCVGLRLLMESPIYSSAQPREEGTLVVLILKMRRWRLREGK